jgi:hypothetical protein
MGRNTVPIIRIPMPAVSHPPVEVTSSCLLAIAYHEPLSYLYAQFKSSELWYIYPGVPLSTYEALVNIAESGGSVGQHFITNVKKRYPAIDINNEDA